MIKNTDTSITINGVRNRLSSLNAAYPNKNTHFTYILSQNEAIDKLEIEFSKGRYEIHCCRTTTYKYVTNQFSQFFFHLFYISLEKLIIIYPRHWLIMIL